MTNFNREAQIYAKINELEEPLLSEHKRLFLNWKVCGPAVIALSRILGMQTDVAVGRDLNNEHLEIDIRLYDPLKSPNRMRDFTEHAYIKYYPGDGNVVFIDPTTRLRLDPNLNLNGAIIIEKYPEELFSEALINQHSLYPFNKNHELLGETVNAYSTLSAKGEDMDTIHEDLIAAMNDQRCIYAYFEGSTGYKYVPKWHRVGLIIRKFIPDFVTDTKGEREARQQYDELWLEQLRASGAQIRNRG